MLASSWCPCRYGRYAYTRELGGFTDVRTSLAEFLASMEQKKVDLSTFRKSGRQSIFPLLLGFNFYSFICYEHMQSKNRHYVMHKYFCLKIRKYHRVQLFGRPSYKKRDHHPTLLCHLNFKLNSSLLPCLGCVQSKNGVGLIEISIS